MKTTCMFCARAAINSVIKRGSVPNEPAVVILHSEPRFCESYQGRKAPRTVVRGRSIGSGLLVAPYTGVASGGAGSSAADRSAYF